VCRAVACFEASVAYLEALVADWASGVVGRHFDFEAEAPLAVGEEVEGSPLRNGRRKLHCDRQRKSNEQTKMAAGVDEAREPGVKRRDSLV
jgi:hypothetical protein